LHQILVVMTGNYDNTAQPTTDKTASVVVAKPATTNQTTVGGMFKHLTTAAGTYAENSSDGTFTVGMTYNKSGSNLQGQIMVSVRQTDGSVIYVKSNSISNMTVTGTTNNKNSTIYTKSSIYKVLGTGSQVTIDGNVTLRLDTHDGGLGPLVDSVGVTVLSTKDSCLYYSNNWVLSNNVWQTLMETLKTGDVSIQ